MTNVVTNDCIVGELTVEAKPLSALKCLASFLVPKVKKQVDKQSSYTSIPNLLIDAPVRILFLSDYYKIAEWCKYLTCIATVFVILQNSTSFSVCGFVQQSSIHCSTV